MPIIQNYAILVFLGHTNGGIINLAFVATQIFLIPGRQLKAQYSSKGMSESSDGSYGISVDYKCFGVCISCLH